MARSDVFSTMINALTASIVANAVKALKAHAEAGHG